MDELGKMPAWETVTTSDDDVGGARVYESRVFGVREMRRRSPRTGGVGTYQVLEMPHWVNVVALTRDHHVVLVEQYRHGTDAFTLEIPGGMVDVDEDPRDAVARELAEETGYVGEAPILLGDVHPNPAIQNNICSSYLIRGAELAVEPSPDEGEHIAVHTAPLAVIPELMRQGVITHSLVIGAFYWLNLSDDAHSEIVTPDLPGSY